MIIIFYIFFFITPIQSVQLNPKLVSTHMAYRLGDRSPTHSYPKSTTAESYWRNGLGQLTVRGQIQQIRLGRYFRERYSDLLNLTYVASEINIRSSDYNRTLMSAYSNLLGLYPTSIEKLDLILSELEHDDSKWPDLMPWQPIPVNTAPRETDYLMGVAPCPYLAELVEQIRNSEQIKNITREYRDFFNQLEFWTGANITDLFDAWPLGDTIIIEESYNRSSSWVNSSVVFELQQIIGLCYYYMFNSSETSKLVGGPMISDIMEDIDNFMSNKSNGLKAKIYSAHDTGIAAILSFIGANYIQEPPYCGTVFFDLYHLSEDNTYYLKVEYLNSTNSNTTYPIKLPPCDDVMCSIDILKTWLKNRLPDKDMAKECMPRKFYPSFVQSIFQS